MNATTAIAIRDDQVTFDEFQRKALAHMGVERATDADLAIFMHQCKRTGLDPFARQIHMIGRNSKNQRTQQWETKFTIQTGIDGYRLIARRAAGREGYGYEDTLWCGSDGVWSSIWLDDKPPVAAKVVVVRGPLQGLRPDQEGRRAKQYLGTARRRAVGEVRGGPGLA